MSDNGATVDEISAVSMEGTYGAGSLSCLSNPSSGGDVFWLRAHACQEYPFRTNSAFQFRARVGFGAVPLVKPRNNRPVVYVPESRNTVMDLTANQTRTFAHTRVPGGTFTLFILNLGVKVLTGTANTVRLQVWNLTTNTEVHAHSLSSTNWRHDNSSTQEFAYKYPLTASHQLEFRLIETGGNPATASAFIEFGFGI